MTFATQAWWITADSGKRLLCMSDAGILARIFKVLQEMREQSPYWKHRIDELAEEIWPTINQKAQ